MAEIKYTIIIPHYNIPDLLTRCIRSIPDVQDIQVIVSDDCSPNVQNYLFTYPELRRKNVIFHVCRHNGGGGHARNEALKFAKGKWLLFADADDFFPDNFYDNITKYYDSQEDIIYFNTKTVYSDNIAKEAERNKGRDKNICQYRESHREDYLRYRIVEPWAKMIRRSLVVNNQIFFDETPVANDYLFSIKVGVYATSIKLSDDINYVNTQREGSVSGGGWNDSMEKLLIRLDVASRVQQFLEKKNIHLKPTPVRGFLVVLLKRSPILFLKKLIRLKDYNISICKTLLDIANIKYMSKN